MLKTKDEIRNWLKSKGVTQYVIRDNLIVNIGGGVSLQNLEEQRLPVQFGEVQDWFDIRNNKLLSLKGCPHFVGESFYCQGNKLKSLEYAPDHVGVTFNCSNNPLESFQGISKHVGGVIYAEETYVRKMAFLPENFSILKLSSRKKYHIPGFEIFYKNDILEITQDQINKLKFQYSLESSLAIEEKAIPKRKI